MKTNDNVKGGKLKPEFYGAYANYFVKYIQGMRAGRHRESPRSRFRMNLSTLTVPRMVMPAAEEADFIKNNLGPAFKGAHIAHKDYSLRP